MRRLPLVVQDTRTTAEALHGEPRLAASSSRMGRFRKRDYVLYAARLAEGMLASRAWGRHRPLLVNIEPTHHCNLHCIYCDKANAHSPQMSNDAALDIIDELAELGTLSVCFDGGEPLLHPGIELFVRRAKSHGMRVSMSSNGHLIRLNPRVMSYVDLLKISVDGPSHVHDAGRGAGALARALEGARLAIAAGTKVAIRMTLAEHNLSEVPAVLRMARELGVRALFQPAVGSVMDSAHASQAHCANPEAYRATIDTLKRLKASGEPIANESLCLDHLRQWPDPKPVPFCSGGRVEVAIGPDGGMFPCGRRGRQQSAPNVFDLGVAGAFALVARPTDCANCWCTLTVAGCYFYRGDPRLLAR